MIHELSGEECQVLLSERDDLRIIDVRNEEEFGKYRLPNAINIDIMSNNSVESFSMLNKDDEYLVYCAIGVRSRSAIKLMEQLGFSVINHLTEGIISYQGQVVRD